ncbi:MAG: DUF1795 domain-containing protein, partial [Chloroflexaceae bacterium]|nr:DUF1795 domain-containing protein [Chloroflexaceae bacterium]
LTSLKQETPDLTTEPPQDLTLGGQPARMVYFESNGFSDLDGTVAGHMVMTVPAPGQVFLLMALATPPDSWQWDAHLQAVLASVRFVDIVPPIE